MRNKLVYIFGISIILSMSVSAVSAQPPPIPANYSGSVTVNGVPAPDGTLVFATIEDYTSENVTVSGGVYKYLVVAPPSNAYVGKTIEFWIDVPGDWLPVKAKQTDVFQSGHENLSFNLTTTIPPVVTLPAYAPDPTTDSTPTYSGTATDATTNVVDIEYRVDVGAWADVDPFTPALSVSFTFTTPALADGIHTIDVRAKDEAGNWSAIVSDTLTVDTVPPTVTITSPAHGAVVTTATITVTAEATDVTSGVTSATITGVSVTITPGLTVSFSRSVTLAEGAITITATASDGVGLTGSHSITVTYKPPVVPPPKASSSITCSVSPASITLGAPVSITGAISPAYTADVRIGISTDGGVTWTSLTTVTSLTDGSYSYTWVPTEAIEYKVRASWPGDADHYGATSDVVAFTVMTYGEFAQNLATTSPVSAARTLENIPIEHAAKIIDAGLKAGLIENMASILNEMDPELAADLLKAVYDLPETPESAAELLGAMSLERSVAVVQILIERGAFEYVDGMFAHLTDARLNDIYGGLTVGQRGELYPHLSTQVRDRISADLLPRFRISNLVISKVEVELGEPTTISVDVANTGGTPATYTVELRVDGLLVDSQDVSLSPGQTKKVSFTLSRDEEGTYQITVDGLTGSFEVRAPPKPFPWALVIGIIVVIVIVVVGAIMIRKRRR